MALGGLLHQTGVLGGEGQAEHRLEVALEDRLPLHPQVGQIEGPAFQGLEQQGGIEAEALGERHRLRAAFDDRQHPAVGDQLQPGSRPRFARPHGLLPDRVEDRLDPPASRLRTGGQDHKRALLGGLLGAKDG